MKKEPLFLIDTFTEIPFRGNPAAVCLLDHEIPATLMLSIAMETKASETAFLLSGENHFSLRWFSQTQEIELCGHGTLATAHVLWEKGILPKDAAALFHTKSGLLTVELNDEWLEMDLPVASISPVLLPEGLLPILKVNPVNCVYAQDRYVIEVETEAEVKHADPDIKALRDFDPVVITSLASAESDYDFVSRTFAPGVGIDEDPVTGSSHCSLTPYYAEKLKKNNFHSSQLSKRGGELRLRLAGDRVIVSGKAVTVFEGHLILKND